MVAFFKGDLNALSIRGHGWKVYDVIGNSPCKFSGLNGKYDELRKICE